MPTEIDVLQPGLFSTIQDAGRFGYQKFGVPKSGVMDSYAARFCNLILSNSINAALLEITFQGPRLKFNATTKICITGADLSPILNDKALVLGSIIEISAGDILKFGKRKSGFRAYLGISGGFQTEEIMESRSWYEDLTSDFRLLKGMKLPFGTDDSGLVQTNASLKFNNDYLFEKDVEVFSGPEFSKLPAERQQEIFNSEFTINESSNRMAIQMNESFHNELHSIITGPVLPGTIQLTPSGKLIILMKDCQTTGGYPRILQVSEKGLQVLSQKLPGEKIKFKKKDY